MSLVRALWIEIGVYQPAQADMGQSYEIWRWKHVAQGDLGRTRKCPETRSRSSWLCGLAYRQMNLQGTLSIWHRFDSICSFLYPTLSNHIRPNPSMSCPPRFEGQSGPPNRKNHEKHLRKLTLFLQHLDKNQTPGSLSENLKRPLSSLVIVIRMILACLNFGHTP